jgi:hypothetical protein
MPFRRLGRFGEPNDPQAHVQNTKATGKEANMADKALHFSDGARWTEKA